MLDVKDLTVSYGESVVIRDMSFSMKTGETLAIMGRNGMGKTTLMKSLIGMVPVKTGHIELEGTDVAHFKSYKRVVKGIAFVPQGRMIFSNMTVKENIETGLFAHGTSTVPPDIYTLFPVLQEMRARRGGNLSGGQQQMLAIARALATNPKVLLLDEPTEGIQPSIIQELARTLKHIRDERGLSIICSEQVLSFALEIADRVLVLEGGNIVHEDDRADVDEEKVARYLAV
jgi:urea transport system ATP-binding protein